MGVAFADFDHDGFMDVFVANDNAPNQLFHNLGGKKFEEIALQAGVAYPESGNFISGMGCVFVDIDNDGRVDAVITVLNGKMKYFHNISQNDNHWILLKLVGVKSNRMGLGAQVRITTPDGLKQWNHATTSTGYACSSDPRVHFGLGLSKLIREMDITWPSRIHQTLHNVHTGQILTITEQAGETAVPAQQTSKR